MRHFVRISVLLLSVLSLAVSCRTKARKIELRSVGIERIEPHSLKSVGVVAEVGIYNPYVPFKVLEPKAVVKRSGEVFAEADFGQDTGNLAVPFRGEGKVRVCFEAKLDKGVSIVQILSIIQARDLSQFTVDCSCIAKTRLGFRKRIQYRDIPIEKFLR